MAKKKDTKPEKYHHGDLRNALIAAATQIITEESVQKLSVRYAAKKSGVSHTAPYRHFKNKEELLVAIAIEGFDTLSDKMEKAVKVSKTTEDQVFEIGRAYIEFALNNSDCYKIMFGDHIENKTGNADFYKAYDRSFQHLISVIKNLRQNRLHTQLELEITVLAVWSLLHGYCSFLIDNKRDNVIGSKDQIDLMLNKVLFLCCGASS